MPRLPSVEDQPPAATAQRRIARAPRRVALRPARRPRTHPGGRARRAVAVNPVRQHVVASANRNLAWPRVWVLLAVGIMGVALAVWYLTRFPQGAWPAGLAVVLAVAALAAIMAHTGFTATTVQRVRRGRHSRPGRTGRKTPPVPVFLVVAATLGTLAAAIRQWEVDLGAAGWDVGLPWLIGIVLFGLLAWWPILAPWLARARSGPRPAWPRPPFRIWAPWVAMTAVAAAPQLPMLGRYPALITGDEGEYLMMAVSARDGTMTNPFTAGWLEVPLLYPAVAGWLAPLAGGDIAGHRLLGGLVGTAAVLATWRFGRHVVGPWPALAGACLLATLPFHLVFSRSAMNHVLDPASLMLSLLFLWRGVHTGRRGDAFVCGVILGVGWYGYWGARTFPAIVAIILVILATDRRVGWLDAIRLGLWSALGFVVTAAPLLVTFAMHPEIFQSRFEAAAPGEVGTWGGYSGDASSLYLANLRESIFLPFIENLRIWFRNEAPFLGWPLALLIAIGCAAWIAGLVRARTWREGAWLAVPWGLLTFGLAATNPIESQRFMALGPLWMLLAGCGVVAVVRWVTAITATVRPVVWQATTIVTVAALAAANLAWISSDDRQFSTWGDTRTLAAWDVGWRLAQDDADVPVTMIGAPYMYISAWDNLRFLARDAVVADVEGETLDPATAPSLEPGSLVLLVTERAGERCQVEAIYPDAAVDEVRARDGTLLYLAFHRGELPGWAIGATPEGTTWAPASAAECQSVGHRTAGRGA